MTKACHLFFYFVGLAVAPIFGDRACPVAMEYQKQIYTIYALNSSQPKNLFQ
jgi:hypothetical protein